MRLAPLALAAAAVHAAVAAPSGREFGCGAPEPDPEHIEISKQFAVQEAAALAAGNFSAMATITVDTYFHVVASSTSLSGGYLTVRFPEEP